MKNLLVTLPLLFLFLNCTSQKSNFEDDVKQFQYELNTQFADAEKSPLTKEDLETFKALEFFEINKTYKVEAEFELTPDAPIFEMQTTTDRLPLYRKYGIARFKIDGKECELSLYQNQKYMNSIENGNQLFLPFNDLTNGKTSYGSGRFINIEIPTEGNKTIIIDFNKSYNPYCAYNYKYSCPIPPTENILDVEIPAGVKNYNKHH